MRGIPYVVVDGETLAGLAERFGVSPEALRSANHLLTDELHPGQPLLIPTVPSELTAEAFPAQGWVPERAWLTTKDGEGEPSEAGDERLRAPVVDRLWRIRAPFASASLALVDHLLLALTASPGRPRTGHSVTLRLLTVNIGPGPLALRYPTTQRAEFVVFRAGAEVFRASRGRAYAQVVQEITLRAGQSELAVEHFLPGEPGEYRVMAVNLALKPARLSLDFQAV